MTASELFNAIHPVFDNWYNNLKKHQQTGSLSSPFNIYCQDTLQLYETEDYFVLELTGHTLLKDFQTVHFNKKIKKIASVNSLINGGTVVRANNQLPAQLSIQNPNEIWANLNVASYDAYDNKNKQLRPAVLQAALKKAPALPLATSANIGGVLLANAMTLRLEAPKLYLQQLPFVLVLQKQTDPIRLMHFIISRLNETFPKRDHIIGLFDDEIEQQLVAQLSQAEGAAFQTLLETQGDQLAHVLGYQSAKTGLVLEGCPQGSIDMLLERADGYYDLLHLSSGLAFRNAEKGKKSKLSLSTYVLDLKAQLSYYQTQTEALEAQGILLAAQPLLIAVVHNSNQVYQQALNKTASETKGDLLLLSIDTLAQLEDKWLKQ